MIQVRPGQSLPLSAVIPDRVSGLVVKAVVESFPSGTVLGTVTLTEVHPGEHMDASFPMPSATDFVRAVFTTYQSDGVTVDTDYGSFDEVYGVVTPVLATPLLVTLGCEDDPLQTPVEVVQDSDLNLLLQFQDESKNAVDTSQAANVQLKVVKQDNTVLVKSLASGISPVSGAKGQYLVQVLAADLELLPLGNSVVQVVLDLAGVHHVQQLNPALTVVAAIA